MLKIETISQQLLNLQAEQPSRYLDMRLNWMSLIRTYIDHFDYMHIPREDISQYDEKQNQKILVILDPDNVRQEITVNANQEIW